MSLPYDKGLHKEGLEKAPKEVAKPAKQLGMVIDVDRCVACQACTIACKSENNTNPGTHWLKQVVMIKGKAPKMDMEMLTRPCQHCTKPPCVPVCPVEPDKNGYRATYKRKEDGRVLVNYDRCIGCGRCVQACPYGVRTLNMEDPFSVDGKTPDYVNLDVPLRKAGVAEKCTFCNHRTDGKTACQIACTAGAIHYGIISDSKGDLHKLIVANKDRAYRFKEDAGTMPNVIYLDRPYSYRMKAKKAKKA